MWTIVVLLVLGAAGLVLAILGWIFAAALFPHAWLSAVFVALGWPLGSIALLLIHALTGGRWGDAVRVPLLLGVITLPVVLVAYVPVAFVFPALYPWAHHDVAQRLYNSWYLNVGFFTGRGLVYVVVWLGLTWVALLGGLWVYITAPAVGATGLIVLAFTISFAATDVAASLDPKYNSSVFGMLTGTGMVLFALSIALLLAVPAARGQARDELGKLLLALCILWAYLDFVQMLVIWSSNLSNDAPWMVRRFHGFWGWSFGVIAALHGFLALLLLAIPRFRRIDAILIGLAGSLIVAHLVRSWWLVLPEAHRGIGWLDVACMVGLVAAMLGLGLLAGRLRMFTRERAHV